MKTKIPTVIQCPFRYTLEQYDKNIFMFYFDVPEEFDMMHTMDYFDEGGKFIGFEITREKENPDTWSEIYLRAPDSNFSIQFSEVNKRSVMAIIANEQLFFNTEILDSMGVTYNE